jgi:hypothetical protein
MSPGLPRQTVAQPIDELIQRHFIQVRGAENRQNLGVEK